MEKFGYRFSFGPWNIHEGADPFGPRSASSALFLLIRNWQFIKSWDSMRCSSTMTTLVPDLDGLSAAEIRKSAQQMAGKLRDHGLQAEFVAPRLWEHPNTIDGAFTANDPQARQYAIERTKRDR